VYGDQKTGFLQDVAALTGATFIAEGMPAEDITLEDLGHADSVVVSQDSTVILGGAGDKKMVKERIDALLEQLANETSAFRKERIEMRLAKLSGKIGLIKVGGATEVEQRERKFRIEDAVAATKAAREEGVVPGGATTLLRIGAGQHGEADFYDWIEDEAQGFQAVLEALQEPFRVLTTNAGMKADYALKQVLDAPKGHGFDVKDETNVPIDLFDAGVIDPTKAIRNTVENACSVAGMAISTSSAITIIPKTKAGDA
jgi:chaperonin GroEL